MNAPLPAHVSPARRRLILVVLLGVTMTSLLDRQILAILAQPVSEDLDLTDAQLGLLGGVAFAAVYAVLTVPVGWLADRVNRTMIIATATATWSVVCAACGLAGSFSQLLLTRMGVAVGEAGATPPAHSLAADLYPPHRRGIAIATIQAGAPLGLLLAFVVGGLVAESYGWRMAFFVAAVPGLVMAVLVLIVLRDPRRHRGSTPAPSLPARQFPTAVKQLLQRPAMGAIVLGGVLAAFAAYGALAWLPVYFQRSFGWTSGQAGVVLGLMFGLLGLIGTWAGGACGDRASIRRPDGHTRVVMVAMLVSAVALAGFLATTDPLVATIVIAVPICLIGFFQGPLPAAVQNAAPDDQRGLASAFYIFAVNLAGQSLGPTMLGIASDLADTVVPGSGLRIALGMVPIAALASALVLRRAGRLTRNALVAVDS